MWVTLLSYWKDYSTTVPPPVDILKKICNFLWYKENEKKLQTQSRWALSILCSKQTSDYSFIEALWEAEMKGHMASNEGKSHR